MSTFPSILTTYTNPSPTSPLNAPSHSGIETAQNSGLSQLEATVGLVGSASTLGTVIGDLRSPASNGGGHVQSANTGGTGQTSFNKGDMLAASGSSVLSKVAIGTDGQVLKADSTQTSGVSWSGVVANKVGISSSVVSMIDQGSAEVILFSIPIPASTLGTNNALRFKAAISQYSSQGLSGADSYTFRVKYGPNSVLTMAFPQPAANPVNLVGNIEGMIVANATDASQKGFGTVFLTPGIINNTVSSVMTGQSYGTSSTISSAPQTLVITGQGGGAAQSHTSVVGQFIVVEKIL